MATKRRVGSIAIRHRRRLDLQYGLHSCLALGLCLCLSLCLSGCGAGGVLAGLGIADSTKKPDPTDTPALITELNVLPLETPERLQIEFRMKNEDSGRLSARVEFVPLDDQGSPKAPAAATTPVPGATLPEEIAAGDHVRFIWDAKRDLADGSATVQLVVTPKEDGREGEPFRSGPVRAGNTPVRVENVRLATQANRLDVLFNVVDQESDRAVLTDLTVEVVGEGETITVPFEKVDRRDFPGSPSGERGAFGFDVTQIGHKALAEPGFVGGIVVNLTVRDYPAALAAIASGSLRFDNNEPPFAELLEVPQTDLSRGVVRLRYRLYDRELNRASVQVLVDVGAGFEPAAPYVPGRSSGTENLATLTPEVFGEEAQPFHTFLWDALVQANTATSFRWKLIAQDRETGPEAVSPPIEGVFSPTMKAPRQIQVGKDAYQIVTGDFNGDGVADAVSGSVSSSEVTFLKGDPLWGLTRVAEIPTGQQPWCLLVGDFDRDDFDDVAVSNYGSHTITYLRGTPLGLRYATDLRAGNAPWYGAAADFNGDGFLDAAFTNHESGNVTYLVGSETGLRRTDDGEILAGNAPFGIATADFNQDGYPDVIVANGWSVLVQTYLDHRVTLIQGGPRGLRWVREIETGRGAAFVVAHDFDGDGFPDAVVTNGFETFATYLRGGDDGLGVGRKFDFEMATVADAETGWGTWGLGVGDYDGDGATDVTVTFGLDPGQVVMLRGGPRGLEPTPAVSVGLGPQCCPATADFDHDGFQDLFVPNEQDSQGTYLRGSANGFRIAGKVNLGKGPAWAVPGDFNDDGVPEIVVNERVGTTLTHIEPHSIGLFADDAIEVGTIPGDGVAADLDGNGYCDLVFVERFANRVSLVRGAVDGAQRPTTIDVGNGPRAVLRGDFNGDERPDLMVLNELSDSVTCLYAHDGGISREGALELKTGKLPYAGVAGDFNHDGALDLLVADIGSSDLAYFRGSTNGLLPGQFLKTAAVPIALSTGDYNGDAVLDLAIANRDADHVTVVWGWVGDGLTNARQQLIPVGNSPVALSSGDFDADGRLDLAVGNQGSDGVTILRGSPAGLVPASESPVGDAPQALEVGDFDGDGADDLLALNARSQSVTYLQGGAAPLQRIQEVALRGPPASVVTGDINGDGFLDCLIASDGSSNVTVLLGGAGGLRRGGDLRVTGRPQSLDLGDIDGDGIAEAMTLNAYLPTLFESGPGNLTMFQQAAFAPRVNRLWDPLGQTPSRVELTESTGKYRLEITPGSLTAVTQIFVSATPVFPLPQRETERLIVVGDPVRILPDDAELSQVAALTIRLRGHDRLLLERVLADKNAIHVFRRDPISGSGTDFALPAAAVELVDISGGRGVRFPIDRFGTYLVAFRQPR